MISGSCHCGAVTFSLAGQPQAITACNCTICRRYGTLWAYGFDLNDIRVQADPQMLGTYTCGSHTIGFHFCKTCACVTHWRGLQPLADGRTRIAVNLRMAAPEAVAALPLERFDGLTSWRDLPPDGRCVADIWW